MMSSGLPDWVWKLIDALDRSGDEHQLLDWVPDEILQTVAYIREREIEAKGYGWNEGFTACAHQHMAQRENPNHAIRRDNPYEQVPF